MKELLFILCLFHSGFAVSQMTNTAKKVLTFKYDSLDFLVVGFGEDQTILLQDVLIGDEDAVALAHSYEAILFCKYETPTQKLEEGPVITIRQDATIVEIETPAVQKPSSVHQTLNRYELRTLHPEHAGAFQQFVLPGKISKVQIIKNELHGPHRSVHIALILHKIGNKGLLSALFLLS